MALRRINLIAFVLVVALVLCWDLAIAAPIVTLTKSVQGSSYSLPSSIIWIVAGSLASTVCVIVWIALLWLNRNSGRRMCLTSILVSCSVMAMPFLFVWAANSLIDLFNDFELELSAFTLQFLEFARWMNVGLRPGDGPVLAGLRLSSLMVVQPVFTGIAIINVLVGCGVGAPRKNQSSPTLSRS